MTDKEIEDEIFKALINGDAQLTPASELGLDEDAILDMNADKILDGLYESYCAMCQFIEEEPNNCIEKYEPANSLLAKDILAGNGQYGMLKWYSLSVFFDKRLHSIDKEEELYNDYHDESAGDEFLEGPSEHMAKAINNNEELINLLRNPIIVSCLRLFETEDFSLINNQMAFEASMKNFIGSDLFTDISIYIDDEKNACITNSELVKSKDVIIPYLICNQDSLKKVANAAKTIMNYGANCVVAIFVTRLVPAKDGREVSNIPHEHKIASFSPRFGIGGLFM